VWSAGGSQAPQRSIPAVRPAFAKALFCNFINDIVHPNNAAAWSGVGGKKNDCGLDLRELQSINYGRDCGL